MKKIAAVLILCTFIVAALSGCNGSGGGNSIVADEFGYADGGIGDTLRNVWFEYTVVDAKKVETYAGVFPAEGNIFIDVELKIRNISGIEVPMSDADFQFQWGPGEDDYGYVIEAVTDDMLPEEFELAKGETVTYQAVFEVPDQGDKVVEYSISFVELFADGETGNMFFVYFKL